MTLITKTLHTPFQGGDVDAAHPLLCQKTLTLAE